jgi:hypothetical protein
VVKLKDHPLLLYHGVSSWPPAWAWIGLSQNKYPKGEVGILKEVSADTAQKRCFLTIEYENDRYMGCLFVSDRSFCQQLFTILQQHLGWTVEQVGGLDVSDTL